MKLIFSIIFFVFFSCPLEIFSQFPNEREIIPEELFPENTTFNSISNEQIWYLIKSDIFTSKESRTIPSKTILENGFLLFEQTKQDWDGSNWVNLWKPTYTYDRSNNMIEELWQDWDGSNWVNSSKHTYT